MSRRENSAGPRGSGECARLGVFTLLESHPGGHNGALQVLWCSFYGLVDLGRKPLEIGIAKYVKGEKTL